MLTFHVSPGELWHPSVWWCCSVSAQPQVPSNRAAGTSPVIRNVYLHRKGVFFLSFLGYSHLFCTFWGTCTLFFLLKGILITHPFSFSIIFPGLGSSRAEMTLPFGFYSLWSWLFEEFTVLRGLSQNKLTSESQLGELSAIHTSAGSAELNFTINIFIFSSSSPVLILPYGSCPYNQNLWFCIYI